MQNVKPPTSPFPARSLQGAGTAHTVRLQALVEKQAKIELGQRIRDLREASPHTNRSIADAVGVSERAVTGWISGRGASWENVEAVAELFRVDPNWLWSGRESGETPDLAGGSTERFDRLEEQIADLQQQLADMAARDKAVADRDAARSTQKARKQPRAPKQRKSS